MRLGGRITFAMTAALMTAVISYGCSDDDNDNRGVDKALVVCMRSGKAMAECMMTGDGGMLDGGGMADGGDAGMIPDDPGIVYAMGKIPPNIYRINGSTATLEKVWSFADGGVTGTAHHVTVNAAQSLAFATMYNPARVVAYNLDTNSVAKVINLGTFAFDDSHDARLIFDEKYLVVSVHREEQLVVIDVGTLNIVQRILRRCPTSSPNCDQPGGWPEPNVKVSVNGIVRGPHAVVISPDKTKLAVGSLNTDQPQVVLVDLRNTTEPLTNVRGIDLINTADPNLTSAKPSELTWTADSKGLYVGTDYSDANNFQPNEPRLWYVDVQSSKAYKVATVNSVPNDLVLTCDQKKLFFNVGNFTQVFDVSNPDRTQPVPAPTAVDTGSRAHGIVRSPDCKYVYTTNEGANWVTRLNVNDYSDKVNIPGILDPEGIFVMPSQGM